MKAPLLVPDFQKIENRNYGFQTWDVARHYVTWSTQEGDTHYDETTMVLRYVRI